MIIEVSHNSEIIQVSPVSGSSVVEVDGESISGGVLQEDPSLL